MSIPNSTGVQIPIAITTSFVINGCAINKIFTIEHNKLDFNNLYTINICVNNLWKNYFDFISEHTSEFKYIFVHNLGKFDGVFLYKALLNFAALDSISTIIDDKNSFISIKYKVGKRTIEFKDSFRIFPLGLNELCETFGVSGKTSKYNNEFNNISLFKNKVLFEQFTLYSLQDSIALNKAMTIARNTYLDSYKVDLCKIFSTSTLSLKIFRTSFLKLEIPILSSVVDSFIRRGYFGGATDYYKCYAEKLYYYDVNSLYPFVMKYVMPHKLKAVWTNFNNFNLDLFFGFLEVEVTCPKNIKIPVLPHKYNGKTIYPTGSWVGVYFSEELKAVVKLGYTFRYIKGYQFSKTFLFNDYMNHFYDIKKVSEGARKFIAKLQLNTLYGYFGRRRELLSTMIVLTKDLVFHLSRHVVKSVVKFSDTHSLLLITNNLPVETVKSLTMKGDYDFNPSNIETNVKSNVAIAAAVTSYARIHMMQFKLDGTIVYTDTDSIFTTEPFPASLIGSALGMMKDEMKGMLIDRAYFLGIKNYVYQYTNTNGETITKSVFAGVEKDSVSWNEVELLIKGESIKKNIERRFFRNMKTLDISIKPTKLLLNLIQTVPVFPTGRGGLKLFNNNFK